MLSIGDIIYDSTNPNAIPITAKGILQYIDGANFLVTKAWQVAVGQGGRLAQVDTKIRIAVLGSTNDGEELDVESDDATPAEAAPWAKMRLAAGEKFVVIYCNRSNMAIIENNLQAAGLSPTQVGLHVSTLDGTRFVQSRRYPVVAVQFTDTGSVDESVITAHWPGVTEEEEGMIVLLTTSDLPVTNPNSQQKWAWSGGMKTIITSDEWHYFSMQSYVKILAMPFASILAIPDAPSAAMVLSFSSVLGAVQTAVNQLSLHSDPAVLSAVQAMKAELDSFKNAFHSV